MKKRINGKEYTLFGSYPNRASANIRARDLRNSGYNARVVVGDYSNGKYGVFATHPFNR